MPSFFLSFSCRRVLQKVLHSFARGFYNDAYRREKDFRMSAKTPHEFGSWRAFLWPVYTYELKKIIPMLLLFFFITFNYTILRDTKDTLVVTAAGAEALPFIKVWGTMPVAILFMIAYSELSNYLSRGTLFYLTIVLFLGFFVLFATVLYPQRNVISPNDLVDFLEIHAPVGLQGLVECVRNWSYVLFDIMAELWGSAVLGLLFWGFANDTTKISEAKRFYALFGIGANLSLLVSGPLTIRVSNIRSLVPEGIDAWQISLRYITLFVVIAGFLIMAIYWWINRYVLTDPRFYDPREAKERATKPHLSLKESLIYLASSRYILCITALVICYGVCINLLEVTWKAQLRIQYPNPNDYNTFMGYFSTATGITTLFMMLFIGGNLLRYSWKITALMTPIVLLITGTGFFGFVLFGEKLSPSLAIFGTSPLWLAVLIGAIQNVLSKAAKYSLFDPSKEMVYIPLDPESKVKGKAVIDVVGSRFGKSGGSLIQQVFLLFFGSLSAITPYIAATLFIFIAIWILAVQSLSIRFAQASMIRVGEQA
jgi:ATP:ADP antiporter, AAA family